MSLVMALEAKDCVVLAGDTKGLRQLDGMNYERGTESKLRSLEAGCAVGMTGDLGLMRQFLDDCKNRGITFGKEKPFSGTVYEFENSLRELFAKRFEDTEKPVWESFPSSLILAGHGVYGSEQGGFIYTMQLQQNFAALRQHQWDAIGQELHGGIYYLSQFHKPGLPDKHAAFLAYFCISEVAERNGTVGKPIDIVILQDNKIRPAPEEWLKGFEADYHRAHEVMADWFREGTVK